MEDNFFIFHTGNFLPFHFHSILNIFDSIFHSIPNFSSIFHFIPKKLSNWKQCKVYFAPLQCCKQPLVMVCVTIQRCNNRYLVCTLHNAHGLTHTRGKDFGLGAGPNRKSHAMTSSEIFKKIDFLWDNKE